jgi:hypothetical protein
MKTTITIEQFDNGISIKYDDDEGNSTAIVSLDRTKEEDIGKMIWNDINDLMNAKLTSKVTMNIEITTD